MTFSGIYTFRICLIVQRQDAGAVTMVKKGNLYHAHVPHSLKLFVSCSGGSKVRVRHSYQDVVEACCKGLWPHWPGLGGWMVNVAQVSHTHTTHECKPTHASFFILQIRKCFVLNKRTIFKFLG